MALHADMIILTLFGYTPNADKVAMTLGQQHNEDPEFCTSAKFEVQFLA